MTAKKYLQQARIIERALRSKSEQIERLQSLAVYVSQPFDSAGSGGSHSSGSKVENFALQLVELKERVAEESARLIKLRAEISAAIHAVNNLTYENILEERYLNYKSFDEIADCLGVSKDYVFRLHREALRLVKVQ